MGGGKERWRRKGIDKGSKEGKVEDVDVDWELGRRSGKKNCECRLDGGKERWKK